MVRMHRGVDHLRGRPPLRKGGAKVIQKQNRRRHIIHQARSRRMEKTERTLNRGHRKSKARKRSRRHLTVYPRPSMHAPYARQ